MILFKKLFQCNRAVRRLPNITVLNNHLLPCSISTTSKVNVVCRNSITRRFPLTNLTFNRKMATEVTKPRYADPAFSYSPDTPVVPLDAKDAFEKLSDKEKMYSHYMSRASVFGGLIVLLQTSPESPQIFRLLQRLNTKQSTEELFESVKGLGITEDDFHAYLIYCSAIYSNMGNYKGFGDSKFVPDLKPDQFETILKNSKAWADDTDGMSEIWESCKSAMWSLSDKEHCLGLGEKGVTTYFSSNCTNEDSEKINRFFKEKNIEGYINRAIKTVDPTDGKTLFEIRNAAAEKSVIIDKIEFEGSNFIMTAGDYEPLLQLVIENLEEAKKFSANDNESNMLENYIESFKKGSLDAHKNGSRFWIKNKGPIVETYIGFIETYRDPVGMRGEFEGFVAMVNKEQSLKYQTLVNSAEDLLKYLPWPAGFEKDQFLRPDFTSLDVLTFSGSGVPAGINIPNYDEIRQSEGFKNVSLGNVLSASLKADKKRTPFLTLEDHQLFEKFNGKSFGVQVALHELLGHGSGKLLQVNANGEPNFNDKDLVNPLTGSLIGTSNVYHAGDTFDSVFTSLGSAYEECRAEAVGLHLCVYPEVHKILGVEEESSFDVVYVNWLLMCLSGLRGLEMFSTSSNEWKQAHSRARFVILNVLLEAGEGFVTIKEVSNEEDGLADLLLTMDKSKLLTVGKPAIESFLLKLQVLKSTADIEAATQLFDKYSTVLGETPYNWAEWRNIVLNRKRPRRMLVQANTFVIDGAPSLVEYEGSHAGMVRSWSERFSPQEVSTVDKILQEMYERDLHHFAINRKD